MPAKKADEIPTPQIKVSKEEKKRQAKLLMEQKKKDAAEKKRLEEARKEKERLDALAKKTAAEKARKLKEAKRKAEEARKKAAEAEKKRKVEKASGVKRRVLDRAEDEEDWKKRQRDEKYEDSLLALHPANTRSLIQRKRCKAAAEVGSTEDTKGVHKLLSVKSTDRVRSSHGTLKNKDTDHEEGCVAWDGVTGVALDPKEVNKARMVEIEYA